MADRNGWVADFVSSGDAGLSASRFTGRSGGAVRQRVASTGPAPARPPPRVVRPAPAYRLTAVLVDKTTKRPLPDIRVEAWDASRRCTDLLAVARSNASGAFTLTLSAGIVGGLLVERRPAIALRLFQSLSQGSPPEETYTGLPDPAWRWVLGPKTAHARIEVRSDRTLSGTLPTASVVRGVLRTFRGQPIAATTVRVVDVSTQDELELGSTQTGTDGQFEIQYLCDGTAPHFVVRAVGGGRIGQRVLAESPRYCGAPPALTVHLAVGGRFRGASEYERIAERAAEAPDVDLSTADDHEVERLACRLGVAREPVRTLAAARRLAGSTGVPEEAVFGLVRAGVPDDQESFLATHPREVRARLREALAANYMPASMIGRIDAALDRFRSAVKSSVFPDEGDPTSFGMVLEKALPASASHDAFLEEYLRHEGDLADFWAVVPARQNLTKSGTRQTVQFALQTAALSSAPAAAAGATCAPPPTIPTGDATPIDLSGAFHVPLVEKLLADRAEGSLKSVRDLARYTDAQFDALVDEVGAPPATPGLSEAARKTNYKEHLKRTVRLAFPTIAIAAGIDNQSHADYPALTKFLKARANDGFAFGKTRVATHVANATGALARVDPADRADVVDNLKALERLFKLTPHFEQIHALYANNIRSAAHAHALGADGVVATTGISRAAAEKIVNSACAVSGGAIALQSLHGAAFNKFSHAGTAAAQFLPDKATLKPNLGPPLADWEQLFGSEGNCECQHCQSVLSPAAYLVELLQFLDGIKLTGGNTALAVLLSNGAGQLPARRPDIAKIDLNCPNANTPLPYIDLVSEILEHVAAGLFEQQTQLTYPDHLATTGNARDLLATPEVLDPGPHATACKALASHHYPWSLPFHFWLAEARAFAPQLGVPLHERALALQPNGPPVGLDYLPPPYAYDTTRAWERLGLWQEARDILLGQASVPASANWGFFNDNAWATKLLNAGTFVAKSGLSYDELRELLDTHFIRSFVPTPDADNPKLAESGSVVTCDLEKMVIQGLANPPTNAWDALHRFLRLQRRLGWTIDETDYAVATLDGLSSPPGPLVADDELLRKLAIVEHFHTDRQTDLSVVLSWFGPIDTRRRGRTKKSSFYERLFQNPAVRNPVDDAFALASPDGPNTPTELDYPKDGSPPVLAPSLGEHAATIRGALRLSARDFALLTDADTAMTFLGEAPVLPVVAGDPEASSKLTLANLSTLHRIATWARALKLSVQELLSLKRLWGLESFAPADLDPETAYLMSQAADRLRAGGLKASDLLFVLFGLESSGSKLVPKESAIDGLRARLGAAQVAVRAAIPGANDPKGEQLLTVLSQLFTGPDVDHAYTILTVESPALSPPEPDPEAAWFAAYLAKYFAHTDADARFFGSEQLPAGPERNAYAYGHLRAFGDGEKAIAQTLGAELRLSPAVAYLLVTILGGANQRPLLDLCRLPAYASDWEVASPPTSGPPTEPLLGEDDTIHLHRVAAIPAALGATPAEFARLFCGGLPSDRLIDLDQIVNGSSPPVPTADAFRRWLLALSLWDLRKALPGGRVGLVTMFLATEEEILAHAAIVTGWSRADIDALVDHLGVDLGTPTVPETALSLVRLHTAFRALSPFRTDAATVIERWLVLGTDPIDAVAADDTSGRIVRAVKARYSDDEWPDVARPLRSPVREAQRTGLVDYVLSYLLPFGYLKSADDLYGWLLLDTEMSACMLTSRIKLALGSVQTFVQRALLGLEPGVALTAAQVEQWKWTKYYRVWEANRKVFLWPENWLEPALRDDKTPFFKQFESQIRRQEITDETAEEAFIVYLESVANVADLEITALYDETAEAAPDVMHVVGRTRSQPHEYYYRCGSRHTPGSGARIWAPWERIDLDIDSDHMVLLRVDRALVLAWALIEQKPNEEQPAPQGPAQNEPAGDEPEGTEPTRTHLEIGLAISERKQGRWSPPRTSRERFSTVSVYRNFTKLGGNTVPSEFDLQAEDLTLAIAPGGAGVACLLSPRRLIKKCVSSPGLPDNYVSKLVGTFTFEPCRLQIKCLPAPRYVFKAVHDKEKALETEAWYDTQLAELHAKVDATTAVLPLAIATALVIDDIAERLKALRAVEEMVANVKYWNGEIGRLENEKIAALESVPVVLEVEHEGVGADVMWQIRPDNYTTINHAKWRVLGQSVEFEGSTDELQHGSPLMVYGGAKKSRLLKDGLVKGARVVRPVRLESTGYSSSIIQRDLGGDEAPYAPFVLMMADGGGYLVERRVTAEVQEGFRLTLLSHPGACALLTKLRKNGIDGLLNDRDLQCQIHDPLHPDAALKERERALVSFALTSASSVYNWELFFHAPLFIAVRLMAARRFDEARKWFERIFDPTQATPTDDSKNKPWAKPPSLFWKPRPLFENKDLDAIQEEMAELGPPGWQGQLVEYSSAAQEMVWLNGGPDAVEKTELDAQVAAWRRDPFKPYVIARLRIVAFQKTVVIKYVENLIEWGDELFRRDTIESITEATGLYILARDILGPRPPKVAPVKSPPTKMVEELGTLDAFGNAHVEVESVVHGASPAPNDCGGGPPPPKLLTLYFCVPGNEKLDELWDTIADRLFKIRHCMNLDGVVRELALYEPPIDPALLVQAAAAGVDINSVLNDLSGGRLPYRYQVLQARAAELAGGVVQLGQSLLAALEKKDGEELSKLRSGQEVDVLKAQRNARALEVREATQALAGARASVRVIEVRRDHYLSLIAKGPIDDEKASAALAAQGMVVGLMATGWTLAAGAMAYVPDFETGSSGNGGHAVSKVSGGEKIATAFRMVAEANQQTASILQYESARLSTKAEYARRAEEWGFHVRTAITELAQATSQVAAAEIRLAIAQSSLATHDLQIENARAVDEYMRSKLTNEDLYEWMADRLMDVYYEAYKLAYDMAKRAEKAMRAELAVPDGEPRVVGFGYWDSAKKGLGAGEQLQQALRALDVAYHEQNRRELEITKQVSLLTLFPEQLVKLRETGSCEVELKEEHFDFDYPGHYLRRVKSVSVTIPTVTGPYTGVNCKLTLLKNWMRKTSAKNTPYGEDDQGYDSRFAYDVVPIEAIVTSSGQNDAGMFEAVLRDDRYLPFEGAGALSRWRIELPRETNAFDVSTISDVVLHVRYTARDGGKLLRDAAQAAVVTAQRTGLQKLVSLRTEFPAAWSAFMNPPASATEQELEFTLTQEMFPYLYGGNPINATAVSVLSKWSAAYPGPEDALAVELDAPGWAPQTLTLNMSLKFGEVAWDELKVMDSPPAEFPLAALGMWKLVAKSADIGKLPVPLRTEVDQDTYRLNETLLDIWLLVTYDQDVGPTA